ncbi:hypothetical protein [Rhodococcus rhodochrous]|uniref:hypothetical protein n=1 Tax=Rhodococcus rhodochrous TaxID=1829 RepID=UPI000A58EAA5
MPAPDPSGRAAPTRLDLIPTRLLAPRAGKVAACSLLIGVVAGLLVYLVASPLVAVVCGMIVGVPPAVGALAVLRRRRWIDGTTITAKGALRTRHVQLRNLAGVELVVSALRVSQVVLRLNDGDRIVSVPLALYANGGCRELDVLALRRLADALAASELASAAAMSSVLVEQLRAEAREAGLEQRPLYRAVLLARDAGRVPQTTLTDHEVASLVE